MVDALIVLLVFALVSLGPVAIAMSIKIEKP
jgi:hypothetical protein